MITNETGNNHTSGLAYTIPDPALVQLDAVHLFDRDALDLGNQQDNCEGNMMDQMIREAIHSQTLEEWDPAGQAVAAFVSIVEMLDCDDMRAMMMHQPETRDIFFKAYNKLMNWTIKVYEDENDTRGF